MNAAYVYLQLYKLFDNNTPVKVDCGQLCGKVCCDGEDSGMYLFPGEKEVYKLLNPDWIKLEKSDFAYNYNGKTYYLDFASCKGECSRYERPLSCRIFPLTPHINKSGELEIIVDPRAKRLCPLAKSFFIDDFDSEFVKSVENTFKLLMKSAHFRAFMQEYSLYIDDFIRFYK